MIESLSPTNAFINVDFPRPRKLPVGGVVLGAFLFGFFISWVMDLRGAILRRLENDRLKRRVKLLSDEVAQLRQLSLIETPKPSSPSTSNSPSVTP